MKVLLYSGGLDTYLIDKLWKPDIKLYIDIHGSYSEAEKMKLPPDTKIVDFPFLGTLEQEDKFIPLRNLYFIMIASHFGDEITLGATRGDYGNQDKKLFFLVDTQNLLSDLWHDKKHNKDITIVTDFIYKSKVDLIKEYLKTGGTLEELRDNSFSCYNPIDSKECFSCYPCFRKFALLYAMGCDYPKEKRQKMWQYVKTKIIPTKEEGGYPGTYYTERGNESAYLIRAVEMLRKEFEYEE